MKILVSMICFVNHDKHKGDMYSVYANRLIQDIFSRTPFDIRVATNVVDRFEGAVNSEPSRITILEDRLDKHKVSVGGSRFNYLLKFFALKDISPEYDYVLFLDCDAGITETVDPGSIDSYINNMENQGYDMAALRTEATYDFELSEFRKGKPCLFSNKFEYYGIDEENLGAVLPSEHLLLFKNNGKLDTMYQVLEQFCSTLEQETRHNIALPLANEGFEIGISAFKAGYKAHNMTWGEQTEIFKVGFNANNWEGVWV